MSPERMIQCDAKCWTPVECTRCHRRKQPRGRSVPIEAANDYCSFDCPGYGATPPAPHLWDEHDSTRHYTDPEGWKEHLDECPRCSS